MGLLLLLSDGRQIGRVKNEFRSSQMRVVRTFVLAMYVFRKKAWDYVSNTAPPIWNPFILCCCSLNRVDMDLIDRGNHFVPKLPRVRVATC